MHFIISHCFEHWTDYVFMSFWRDFFPFIFASILPLLCNIRPPCPPSSVRNCNIPVSIVSGNTNVLMSIHTYFWLEPSLHPFLYFVCGCLEICHECLEHIFSLSLLGHFIVCKYRSSYPLLIGTPRWINHSFFSQILFHMLPSWRLPTQIDGFH